MRDLMLILGLLEMLARFMFWLLTVCVGVMLA